jgi:hypothetical protein
MMQQAHHKFTEVETQAKSIMWHIGGVFSYVLIRDFAGSNKAFMLSWHIQVMDKVVFCKDCNHKAGEHGVFEDSDANGQHPCMRSDCGCNRYAPSE